MVACVLCSRTTGGQAGRAGVALLQRAMIRRAAPGSMEVHKPATRSLVMPPPAHLPHPLASLTPCPPLAPTPTCTPAGPVVRQAIQLFLLLYPTPSDVLAAGDDRWGGLRA